MADKAEKINVVTAISVFLLAFVIIVMMMLWPKPVQAVAQPAAMPTQLDLGGVQWKVEVVEYPGDADGVLGFTHCDTHHIQVKAGITDHRETLVHEILHGYVCGNGPQEFTPGNLHYNSSTVEKHDGIDDIAQVITDAMGRNPSLAAYLAEGK